MPCTGYRVTLSAVLCAFTVSSSLRAGPLVPPPSDGPSPAAMTSRAWDVFLTIETNAASLSFPFPGFDRAAPPGERTPATWAPAIRLTTVYRQTDTYRRGGEEFWDRTPGIESVDPGPPDVLALMNTSPPPAAPKKPVASTPVEDIWAEERGPSEWTKWLPGAGGISMLFCLAVLIIVAFKAR